MGDKGVRSEVCSDNVIRDHRPAKSTTKKTQNFAQLRLFLKPYTDEIYS